MGAYGSPELQSPNGQPPKRIKKRIGAAGIIAIVLIATTFLAGIAGMGWGPAFLAFGLLGLIIYLCILIVATIHKKDKKPFGVGVAGGAVVFILGAVLMPPSATSQVAASASQGPAPSASAASAPASSVISSAVIPSSAPPPKAGSAAPIKNSDSLSAGDKTVINGSSGKYSVTVDSITESTKRNEFADEQPKRIIIINYRYENISCKQDITVSYLYFHVYDASGNLLRIYPSTEAKSPTQTISVGKKNGASVAYGLNDSSNKITLELYDVFNPFNRVATYDLDVKK